jgi:Fic-DOC domain mobile mystery protein B
MRDGATHLDPEDLAGLIPTTVRSRTELDAWEQVGILEARRWLLGTRRRPVTTIVSERFLRELHRRMFGATWRWAGSFRTHDTNLGVPWEQLPAAFRNAVADARTWIAQSTYPDREFATRFHHRLVQIHPFPNGNGRWARLAIDGWAYASHHALPSWGGVPIDRAAYIAAMHQADAGDLKPLQAFMWSEP